MEPPLVGIPNLSQLCFNKLSEMYGYQCVCCMLGKLSNTFNKIDGNQIVSTCVNVISVTSNKTLLDLYVSQQYITEGCVFKLVKDPLWSNLFHVMCMTERIMLSVAAKISLAIIDEYHCHYSNSVDKPGRGEELTADMRSGMAGCVEGLESTSVQGSVDEASTSLFVCDHLSADCMRCTKQDGNVTSEKVDSRQIRTENEVCMFDVPYLDRKEKQIENEKDVSTSVLIYRKQAEKEINNEVPVIEVLSLDSKNYEAEATQDVLISDDIYLDIKQLKKNKENLMLLDISDIVYVTLLKHLMKVNRKVIRYEKLFQLWTEKKQKFTQDMNVKLHIYEAGRSDNKCGTTMHYGFRCSTRFRLSSRLHATVSHLQKLCSLYRLLRVCSPSNCCHQFLVCVFMQESDCFCYIINIRRTKKTDIAIVARTDFAKINVTEIRRISTINIARIKAKDIAAINRTGLAENRQFVMYDNRTLAVVLLLSTNDILISQKKLPSRPLANRNRIFSSHASGERSVQDCLASQLSPENTEKTVTRLGTFCSTLHEKNTCQQNNCQIVSPSSSSISVTHTAKITSELNTVQELSSICNFGSKQQIRFPDGKTNHGDVQMGHDSTDLKLFSEKLLRGETLVLLKNKHGRNTEGKMNFSFVDVLDSITLKKLKIEIETVEPSRALKNFCVNMLPRSRSICGIPWNEFERETMRLASFATYPASAAKSPANLASCGFVYVGNGTSDRVKCYFCSVEKESWEMNDNIDDIHKSLSPACPMVIVQFSNNVASNISSPALSNVSRYSSSVIYGSESLQPMAAANAVTSSLSATSGRANSGYDDVDHHRTHAGRQPTIELPTPDPSSSPRQTAVTSSLLTNTNRSINTPGPPNASILSVPEMLQQDTNSADRSNRINLASQNNHSSESLNEESIRNQQNRRSDHHDNISHHPNINTQVYAIPPDTITTAAPDTSNAVQSNSQLTYQLLGIFHERPKFPNYAVLARRLQSFDGWPEHHPIDKEDLVKSGLFFAGYGDCCKCFFCGGGLRNWENDDNAYVEHARWFDKCSYIRQFMGMEFVEAVQSLKNRGGTITFKDVTDYMQTKGQSIQNLFNDRKISDDVAVRSLIDAGYNIEAVSRAALSLRESGELLSADVILREMREQESAMNGAAAAEAVSNDNINSEDVPDEGRLQALKEQNYALRSNLTCKICMDKEVKIVFLPCGHLISCQECAVALQDCPLCRSHIRARARANIN